MTAACRLLMPSFWSSGPLSCLSFGSVKKSLLLWNGAWLALRTLKSPDLVRTEWCASASLHCFSIMHWYVALDMYCTALHCRLYAVLRFTVLLYTEYYYGVSCSDMQCGAWCCTSQLLLILLVNCLPLRVCWLLLCVVSCLYSHRSTEYRGVKKKSFIDGKEILQFSTKKRYGLIWQSNMVIWALIACVIGVVSVSIL